MDWNVDKRPFVCPLFILLILSGLSCLSVCLSVCMSSTTVCLSWEWIFVGSSLGYYIGWQYKHEKNKTRQLILPSNDGINREVSETLTIQRLARSSGWTIGWGFHHGSLGTSIRHFYSVRFPSLSKNEQVADVRDPDDLYFVPWLWESMMIHRIKLRLNSGGSIN
jgi:hypothetical protein